MGFVDTNISQFVPSARIGKTAGTWTPAIASNVVKDARGAAAAQFGLFIPLDIEQGPNYHVGAKIKSIDVWYKIATADAADFATVELEKVTLAADTVAPTGVAVTVSLDSAHDTAAKRKAQADHKMTVTPSADLWLEKGYSYYLYLYVDAAATTAFTLYGAQINYELRE
jgi:hypothetical protein